MTLAARDLKIETTEIRPCVKKFKIEIPEPIVNSEYEKALVKLQKTISVQGFRKGKAPREIIRKLYSESILWDIGQKMISEGYETVLNEHKLRVYGNPLFDDLTVESGKPISFSATVESLPDINIPDYSDWSFIREIDEINDSDIEAPITGLLGQSAELIPVQGREVREKDFVTADYTGKIDGQEIEKLTGRNFEMLATTDESNLMVGFFHNLIGMKAGETKEFKVSIPKQYPDPQLSGKDVEFSVTVHDIKETKLPELTDDFVIANTPYESIADMKKKLRERLEEGVKREGDRKLMIKIMDRMVKETSFDLPPGMISGYADMHANRMRERAAWSGIQLEKTPDFDQQKFAKTCIAAGERLAREEVITSAIAESEGIQPEPKEVAKVQKEYLDIIRDQEQDHRIPSQRGEAERRAFLLAVKEVTTEAVFKHLVSTLKITDKKTT